MTTPLSLSDRGKRLIAEALLCKREVVEAEFRGGDYDKPDALKRLRVAQAELERYVAQLEHCGGTKGE